MRAPKCACGRPRDVPDGNGGTRPDCRACFNAKRAANRRTGRPPGPVPGGVPAVDLSALEQHRLKNRVTELEERNRDLLKQLDALDGFKELQAIAAEARAKVRPIEPRERKSGLREATALALASDWHIEERVLPAQVSGRNRYDLAISKERTTRFFEAVRRANDFNRQWFKIRNLVLWLGGDFITGYLHDDNRESNLLPPPQALARAEVDIGDGIEFLLKDDELDQLDIPCSHGNHERISDTNRSATLVEASLGWLLYTNLARRFAGDPRVRFLIAQGDHEYLDIYGRTVRFTHGQTVRYSGGIGGVTIPLLKAVARWDTVRRAHLTCVGHFHQLIQLYNLMLNGSLIGYNTYAMSIGAPFEPPAQAYRVLDSQRFGSVSLPLWVSKREDDEASVG